MRLIFIYLLIVSFLSAQTIQELHSHLVLMEGYSNHPYIDNLNNWTIGIGHKINNDYPHRKNFYISDEQVNQLFLTDILKAKKEARLLVSSFDNQPKSVRIIIISMIFNLGQNGLAHFYHFRLALDEEDYKKAADELRNSLWAKQLPQRAKLYISILTNL